MKFGILLFGFILTGSLMLRADVAHEIPFVAAYQVDGDASEWDACAYPVKLRADKNGVTKSGLHKEFSADARLAWCRDGLLVRVTVTDPERFEGEKFLWDGDHVSVFLSNSPGEINKIQLVFAPSSSGGSFKIRSAALSQRGTRPLASQPIEFQYAGKENPGGYTIEALLPIANVGVRVGEGAEIGVNIQAVSSTDRAPSHPQRTLALEWNLYGGSHENFWAMNRIRLAAKAGRPPQFAVKSSVDNDTGEWKFSVFAEEGMNGRIVTLERSGQILCTYQLASVTSVQEARFSIRVPEKMEQAAVTVCVDGEPVETVHPGMVPWTYAFRGKVNRYLAEDEIHPFPKGGIVFTGHSQIDMWETLAADMAPLQILGRGISGAQAFHIVEFMDDLVFKHQPSKIVYYIGGNDLHAGKTVRDVMEQIDIFVKAAHEKCPGVKIWLIGIQDIQDDKADFRKTYNSELAAYAERQDDLFFIRITDVLLDKNGRIPEKYTKDGTHFNEAGHALIASALRAALAEPACK